MFVCLQIILRALECNSGGPLACLFVVYSKMFDMCPVYSKMSDRRRTDMFWHVCFRTDSGGPLPCFWPGRLLAGVRPPRFLLHTVDATHDMGRGGV